MHYIDIHGHYAWDVDDGIETKADAINALEKAKQQNITAIVATPHVIPGRQDEKHIVLLKERIKELKTMAHELDIAVYAGCELFLNEETIEALEDHIFISINETKYLLCEFDVRKELSDDEMEVEDRLYEIAIRGYVPIIAHVERYFKGQIDLERIADWIESGYLIQVNATSLLGLHGKTCQNNAYTLIDQGMVHIIASDTHRVQGHRVPNLKDVAHELSKKYDYETVKTLLCDNPQYIIHGQDVVHIEKQKKSLFKKMFGR